MRKERTIAVAIIIVSTLMLGTFVVTIASSKNDKQIIAIFSYIPDNPYTNENVSFNDESTTSNGIIVSWLWDFGDGTNSTEQNPTHSYAENTTYVVSLEVTNNQGLSNDSSQHILVLNRKPISDFGYSPDNPTDMENVTFFDISTDVDGIIVTWLWDFGDGNTSTSQNSSHRYSNNGTFTITLNVTDNDNATNETSQQIIISNVEPIANFTYCPLFPTDLQLVTFTDNSTDSDGNITSWSWEFDDGITSIEQHPTHQYVDNGTYTVTLTVTDDAGATNDTAKQIHVSNVEPPSKVTCLTVMDAKDGKLNLAWNAATDNVTVDYYNIYHNGLAPSPIAVDHPTTTYTHAGLTNGQEYTYNVSAVDTSGNEGDTSDPQSGTPTATSVGGGGGSPPRPPANQNPTANASAGEPYMGIIGDEIIFAGSLSNDADGKISSWNWEFGDGTNRSGENVTHTYSSDGTYAVILTVIDDDGATDSYETVAVIKQPNMQPTSLRINGSIEGNKNIKYDYAFVSTDDNNDTIKYSVDWGDGTVDESDFLPNGTAFEAAHSWASAGKYTATVTADDNQTSTSTETTVMIDAIDAGDIGHVTDDDGDGAYDTFHSHGLETDLGRENGRYLIDSDGDGEWEYFFDLTEGLVPYLEGQVKIPYFGIIFVLFALLLCLACKLYWRRIEDEL